MINFQELIQTAPYDFLRTNPHLGNHILLLTLGGSYAYGTNKETSDIDLRGCALNSPSDLLGFGDFEQFVDIKTDTTIYSFQKTAQMLLNCNPSAIELLGCLPEHYVILSNGGQKLIENRKLFLSQRAAHTFSGYATMQLRKIEAAFVSNEMSQSDLELHMKHVMEDAIRGFKKTFPSFEEDSLSLRIVESDSENLGYETLADFNMKGIPIRQFKGMLDALVFITKNLKKLSQRNRKKDNPRLAKHAMHLIRLYLEGIDVLEQEDIIVNRTKDLDLLKSILTGNFQRDNGRFIPEFYEMIHEFEHRLEYAKKNTSLPPEADTKKVEELVIEINKEALYV